MEILLGDGEHAARPARGVIDGLCDVVAGKHGVIVMKEDVDHELDDFARGIVLPRVFIVRLRKSTDNLLKDVTHLEIGDHIGVQVRLWRGELLEHDIEYALVRHSGDMRVKFELRDNVAHVLGKAIQVGMKIRLDIIGVID